MKAVIIPNNTRKLDEYIKNGARAFVFGMNKFSTGYKNALSIIEIKEIVDKYKEIEIFISINKNIFNGELEELEGILIELDSINIKGVLFYDLSLLELKKKLNLKLDLAWYQNYMVTNYNTCNYYYGKGVKYGVLSQEITLQEMLEIREKTKMTLMSYVLYNPLMSHTRRKLLTNYFSSYDKDYNGKDYILKEKDEEYIITEDKTGDTIYYNKIVNGIKAFSELKENIDYLIFSEDYMPEDIFMKAFKLFMNIKTDKDIEELESLIGNYAGFFYTKTVYKVR